MIWTLLQILSATYFLFLLFFVFCFLGFFAQQYMVETFHSSKYRSFLLFISLYENNMIYFSPQLASNFSLVISSFR